jgi:pimeloyl-ACP methyl ester carboxylesterase
VVGYVGARMDVPANVEAFRRLGGEKARVARADVEDPSEEHLAEFLRVCLPLYSRRPGAVEYFRRMLSIETPEVTVSYMRSHPGGEALVDLHLVSCPVLVLAGEADPVVPPATVAELVEGLRHAPVELLMLPDCGHTVFRDQPEIAYGTVRGFLNRLATGSSG